MRRIKIIFIFVLLAFSKLTLAQIYPVQLSAQLIPPYSGYLPDYADPSSEKLKIILQFNDLTTPQYNIRLRIEIKGNGFSIVTKQLFNPPPLTLQSGVPLLLSGADLAPYLNSNNLDFIGINQAQYEQRMALPEGYYSVCVKAYDYYNPGNIQVSNEFCSQAWFMLSDPPFLNLPQCGKNITPQNPQNILFQWTPMHMSSPNSAANTEYEFALWEVRPDSSANPNQVVLSTAPIFSTTTNLTLLNYGIAEPPLNLYMKYVWRVRAKDITGRDWFKNNGCSQICTFVYGNLQTVLGNALNLSLSAEGVTHRLGRCSWNTQSIYNKYLLQVRKAGTQNWFDYYCTSGFEKVNNLEPNTSYEARVRGEGSMTGDWSNIATFNTTSEPVYGCNDQTQYADVLAAQPLPVTRAMAGLVIQTGQFEVIATQIYPNGPPGWYSGKGYAKVFGALPLQVQFNNIYIDDNNRHQQGVIQAVTKGIDNWLHQWDVKDAEENAVAFGGTVDSVYVNGNQICVKIQGKISDSCFAFPPNQNVIVVRDDDGNQWTVTINPPPPTVSGPTNYLQYSSDELDAGDSTLVVFRESPQQQYGFDEKKYTAWTTNYELIKLRNGKNYFVPYKSVKEFNNDEVYAEIDIKGFVESKLSFKADNGFQLTASAVNNTTYKITVPYQYKSIYAWYDGKKVGKLNVVSLKSITKKLVIVPVGNANFSTSNLQVDLNKIFQQANVSWNVSVKGAFTYNLGSDGLEAADATLMSKYSVEMRSLRDAYKQANADYDKEAYYVFVVNNFSNPELKGYMVRGRALGFVAVSATTKEIAHELAHGAFGLEHTFPSISKNTSENLMDYGTGMELSKVQWEEMQNNKIIISLLDGEEDGSLVSINSTCFFDISNKYVYAPNGKIFKAPMGSRVAYVLSSYMVNGFLYGIDVNNKTYWADVPILNGLNSDDYFGGFKSIEKESLPLTFLTEVPKDEFVHFVYSRTNSFYLYKIKDGKEMPGSNVVKHDLNAGNYIDAFISGNTAVISTSCSTTNLLNSLQQELLDKYKSFSVDHETYVFERGNLVTLLPNGRKYIKKFAESQLLDLKKKLREGKLSNDEAILFEKTLSGYSLSVNYGSNIKAKVGFDPNGDAIDKSEIAFEKVMNNYLKNVNDLSVLDNQQATLAFEDGKTLSIKTTSFWDKIKNGIKATREFIESAEISPKYWNSSNGDYANNWVNTPPLLSGVGNGVINEIKEIPQLVFMGAEIATNKEAREKLWEGLKGLNLTKIKDAAISTLTNWTNTYVQGGDVAWHQGGKDGVMVFSILAPAGFLKGADDVLEKNIDETSKIVKKKTAKINPINIREASDSWSVEKKSKFDLADQFYSNSGYTNYDNQLRGIDFDEAVAKTNKVNGSVVYQMVKLDNTGNPIFGSYFYDNISEDVTKIGIGDMNQIIGDRRVKVKVVLNDNVEFLKSKAADIEDWNGTNKIFEGGGNQLFSSNAKGKIQSYEIIQIY